MMMTKDFLQLMGGFKSLVHACDLKCKYLVKKPTDYFHDVVFGDDFFRYKYTVGTLGDKTLQIEDYNNNSLRTCLKCYRAPNDRGVHCYTVLPSMMFIKGNANTIMINHTFELDGAYKLSLDMTEEQYFQYSVLFPMPFEFSELKDIKNFSESLGENEALGILASEILRDMIDIHGNYNNVLDCISTSLHNKASEILQLGE